MIGMSSVTQAVSACGRHSYCINSIRAAPPQALGARLGPAHIPPGRGCAGSLAWFREVSMNGRDPRSDELNNLKLALATFALHLDAFEARVEGSVRTKYEAGRSSHARRRSGDDKHVRDEKSVGD
jgi:hypothetical protein